MSETMIDNLVIEITANSSAASSGIDSIAKALRGLNSQSTKTGKTASALQKLSASVRSFVNTRILGQAVRSVNDYVENMNLFTVSMGRFSEEATEYAKQVESVLGVNMSEFMRNQAIFKNIADGFGVAEEEAYKLSKGMTELAYDITSFYNSDIETAFEKLRSGLAGEIEPVRAWGIALDQASMKQWLLKEGIDANVNSLTQADKALVRYNMMVESLRDNGAIGDLARTIQTPANAIRILNQQVTQLSRAIGSLLIPIITRVIPYIQAFVKVITNAAQALARLLGIDINFSVDFSGLKKGVGGVGDAMDDAAASAKKLKDYTMGFDELNIIDPNMGAAAKQQTGLSDLGLEAESVWDETILKSINSRVDELAGKMKWLAALVLAVGVAFATWKIGTGISTALSTISKFLLPIAETLLGFPSENTGIAKALQTIAKYKGPIAIAAVAITAVALALVDLWKNSETFRARVRGVIAEVKTAFLELKDTVWNYVAVPIMEVLGATADSFGELYSKYIRPVVEQIAIALVEILGGSVEFILDTFSAMATVFGVVFGAVVTVASDAKTELSATWDQIKKNTLDKVTQLKDGLKRLWNKVTTEVGQFRDEMTSVFEQIKRNISEKVSSIIGFFDGLISKVRDAIAAVKDFFTTDTSATVEVNTTATKGSTVKKYATGGFLEDGLFTMNHGEIAGKFSNGQSVVANNQQIVDGIADGVYRAMMQAQGSESSKPLQVNVYLDGKQISKSVDKYNNSRGISIMGNSLGYNY